MEYRNPTQSEIPQLQAIWREAFGEDYLMEYFRTAFAIDHCYCAVEGGEVLSVIHWMDCTYPGGKLAYLYAIATRAHCRGRGIFRSLMQNTHTLLTEQGYAGTLLYPAEDELTAMYRKFGYAPCGTVAEFTAEAAGEGMPLREISAQEYAVLRRDFLPEDAVLHTASALDFLGEIAQCWQGERALLAGTKTGQALECMELLGDASAAPAVLTALGCTEGTFRTPGNDRPFAMFRPLRTGTPSLGYFGPAFE